MTNELYEALEALCDMWNQYCGDEWGHHFMSAGENCADVLDKYGLLKNDNGTGGEIDWDKLTSLKPASTLSSNDEDELWEEVWDESTYIEDDIDSLQQVAESCVITHSDFKKIKKKFNITTKP